jgi:hypothetical protein
MYVASTLAQDFTVLENQNGHRASGLAILTGQGPRAGAASVVRGMLSDPPWALALLMERSLSSLVCWADAAQPNNG